MKAGYCGEGRGVDRVEGIWFDSSFFFILQSQAEV
jgi:hypothetical protein